MRVFFCIGTFFISAAISSVTFAKTAYQGELLKVVTPAKVEIAIDKNQYLEIQIIGPNYGQDANTSCDKGGKRIKTLCDAISNQLSDKPLGVTIEQYEGMNIYGDIVYGNKLLSQYMIEQGWYPVDNKVTSATYLFNAERQAYCNYRGIWAKYKGQHEVTNKCMRR